MSVPPDGSNPTTVLISNLMLPGHQHAIDVYLPPRVKRAVVFLHGGGGSKEGAAEREIVIASAPVAPSTTPVPDAAWLDASETAFILPQGFAISTAAKATTWNNYVMTSGVDDLAFLGALAAALRAGSFDSRIPSLSRVYLSGHSNGGMMTNRVWCEGAMSFDAYGGISGPASVQLNPKMTGGADPLTGAHPCHPAAAKPYIGIVGSSDTIIQTTSAWANATWAVNSCLQQGNGGSFVDPNLMNEETFHSQVRVPAICQMTAAAPVNSADGSLTTWSDCAGKVSLIRVNGAEHCVAAAPMPCMNNQLLGGQCTNSLEAKSGKHLRDLLLDFFIANE